MTIPTLDEQPTLATAPPENDRRIDTLLHYIQYWAPELDKLREAGRGRVVTAKSDVVTATWQCMDEPAPAFLNDVPVRAGDKLTAQQVERKVARLYMLCLEICEAASVASDLGLDATWIRLNGAADYLLSAASALVAAWEPSSHRSPENYQEYLQSQHWKETRERAIERAGRRCQTCGNTDRLHVHHRTYANLGNERDEDLIVLCASCHGLFHSNMKLVTS